MKILSEDNIEAIKIHEDGTVDIGAGSDNIQLRLGASSDLKLFHDGSHSRISNNTNALLLQTSSHSIQLNKGTSENMLIAYVDGGVKLYYDNSSKLETTSSGATVSGGLTVTGDVSCNGGAGAVTIAGDSDIRFNSGNWTGESCKIQQHSNSLYIQAGSNSNHSIIFRSNGGSDRWYISDSGTLYPATNNAHEIGTSSNGVQNIYMAGGIFLGGTGSSNYLDDYEKGTWNPELKGGNAFAGNHSMQAGSYTKVGRQVTVSFGVTITSKGNMSGDLHIVNLPFGVASNLSGTSIEASGIAGYWKNVSPNLSHITCVADDADAIYLRATSGAEDDPDQLTHSDIDSDFTIRGTVTYFVS